MGASAGLEAEVRHNSGSRDDRGGGPPSTARARATLTSLLPALWLLLLGSVWFVACLATVLWTWGLDPLVFPSSDEAVVRYAAWLIEKGRGPFLSVPLPDPEDLRHPRSWITIGDRATPTYAPVSFYVFGWLTQLHGFGLVLIAALPASGVAAFVAGTARLLPAGRRWLAILAPALAFPALYWLLRPWMNVSPLLTSICWTVFCWASWRESGKSGWLSAAFFCLGYGAAVRPDYAAYLFVLILLFSLAVSPGQWKLMLALVTASGVLALAANLILNRMITGHALKAAYQMSIDRTFGAEPEHTIPGLGMLRSLLLPMGIPNWEIGSTAFRKYWLSMGPIALVLFGQVALVPLLWKRARQPRYLLLAAIATMAFFGLSRMHDDLFGGAMNYGSVHHSVPRYLTPLYLLAALPPLLFLGQCKNRWLTLGGSLLAVAVAATGGYQLWHEPNSSFNFLHDFVHKKSAELERLAQKIPNDAVVYTAKEDKWLWSRVRVWIIEDPKASAQSIERAARERFELYVFEPSRTAQFKQLVAELGKRHISLAKVEPRGGLYRVKVDLP
ncbi:MAG TPA: hypothetical protein VJV79_26175 [Polyangiaceae bacterium]|nr:hypothetical protein [Polyangiaceae bacterium]